MLKSLLKSWVCLFVVTRGMADITSEDYASKGVIVLTSDTFEDVVASNRFILVQFYAPWCGHCKSFRHEYLKAAEKMQEREPPIPFAVVDATSETKLAELYGVRGYPTLKFFHDGKDMDYGGGRMWDNLVAWVEKKSGPALIKLESANEINVFFESKSKESTPSGAAQIIGGGVIVAFTDDPNKIRILESTAIAFDDIFFGLAPRHLGKPDAGVVSGELLTTSQQHLDAEVQDKLRYEAQENPGSTPQTFKNPVDLQVDDLLYMRFPFDSQHAVGPIVSAEARELGESHEDYSERVGDDIRFFVAINSVPNVSVFTGENAAMLFNDPRPMLIFFRDERRGVISVTHAAEMDKGTKEIENYIDSLAVKYKQDFVFVLAGVEQPMDMRLMDYLTVDYEDTPCIRIVKDPTDAMVKYKMPIPALPEVDDKDQLYLQNLQAITPERIERFAEDFLTGEAEPHLKSQHTPKNNAKDNGEVFVLVGEQFLDVIEKSNVLVMYFAPWCGHCKKLDPIYKELAAKYNVPGSNVLIAKFDATVNDTPLEVTDVIQGYPSLKLYRKSPRNSVHYAGDRNLDTLIDFVETHTQTREEL